MATSITGESLPFAFQYRQAAPAGFDERGTESALIRVAWHTIRTVRQEIHRNRARDPLYRFFQLDLRLPPVVSAFGFHRYGSTDIVPCPSDL